MELKLEPGKYVVAVSGGVDSMVLLHMLAANSSLDLVVAHFDHGIRPDSAKDSQFVEKLSQELGLQFVTKRAELGEDASEDKARRHRYQFLKETKESLGAKAIITAHHQDDVIETMMLNLLRGTNRKGLSSLKSTTDLLRPLVAIPKNQIINYAKENNISWREDSTNSSQKYLRNYIRQNVVNNLDESQRQWWWDLYQKMLKINQEIDQEISNITEGKTKIYRNWLLKFPNNIGNEIIAWNLRSHGVEPSAILVQDLLIACKVAKPGSVHTINKSTILEVSERYSIFR